MGEWSSCQAYVWDSIVRGYEEEYGPCRSQVTFNMEEMLTDAQ